jgi:subtilase family serine protease
MGAPAQSATESGSLISAAIDNHNLVTLTGNTRPEATPLNDRGRVDDNMHFAGMELILRRSGEQERAFEKVIADLHDPRSPNFHRWLTPNQIGENFGLVDGDLGKIKNWLSSNGFKVRGASPDRTFISFSGNAGQISKAFHTEIHMLSVKGETRFANMSDPKIPAAVAPAVYGVLSLNDFPAHSMAVARKKPFKHVRGNPDETSAAGCLPASPTNNNVSFTGKCFALSAGDIATIYNFKGAYSAGVTGTGQTVVVVEDTDVYKPADWNIFRTVMGLSSYSHGTFSQVHPTGTAACTDPGVTGDEDEATIDVDWATAAAPDANIVLASCKNANPAPTFGGLHAIQNMIAQANHPNIFSMSYGECEAENGATANAAYNTTFQSAASLGVSIYVSSGDESATSCDANAVDATHGIGVSGWMSSQYDISVGGTEWGVNIDPNNSTAWQTYWSSTNGPDFTSAKSYIPEIPWNDSCASEITASFYTGSAVTYGTGGFCNSSFAENGSTGYPDADLYLDTGSGSGGPSGCATGTPAATGIVGGSCAGWPKPAYQSSNIGSLAGLVNDGVRDTPDVSAFASNGELGSFYPICDHNPSLAGGGFTSGCNTGDPFNWAGFGGTSVSSPIWAGIQALINQKSGTSWGNTNVQYYALAAAEYGPSGNSACNSSLGNAISSSCVFNDVTSGDFNVNCRAKTGTGAGLHNCYLPSGTNGVGTVTNGSYQPMYKSTVGWDFTSGIGTPNVANLVNAMNAIPH